MNRYPRELAPGLWALGDRHTNLYLARGQRSSVLLEAGISANADAVIAQLDGLGEAPSTLLVMHPHTDHLTGLPALRERFPHAEVLAGEGAREFASHPRAAASILAEDRHLWEFYAAEGLRPGRPALAEAPSLEGSRVVSDGEEIDLGGLRVFVLAGGGHSPGQIAAWIPELRAAIVSDALGYHFPERGFFPVYFTSFPAHVTALERLGKLGAEIVCPGHQGPLIGAEARTAFSRARASALHLAARIRAHRHRLDDFAEELFREIYRDEFLVYSEANIRGCIALLIRRTVEDDG